MEIISPEGLRIDGRRPEEIRRFNCRLGVLSRADGSAYLEQGNTKALASINGPHQAGDKAKIKHDRVHINFQYSMATFSTNERRNRPKGDKRSIDISQLMREIFQSAILTDLYPKSQIDIHVQILQADGGNYSACINAATLALMDAGVPMKDFICSCTASLVDSKTIIDVNNSEELHFSNPLLTLAILPTSEEIILCQMKSRLHADHLEDILKAGIKGCKDIYEIMHREVLNHVREAAAVMNAT
ncbi:Exosome complex component RRP41 [Trichoplax sp. H2]|uniref:Putative exosome complex component RRP41 n=1 Tax=Trichoplax adhaerens TaxID=10228 RepID=B3RL48_TRIAD|nr:hypothetical protein TRIADDRAFT_51876 [Trichoplax adhaerens]EDV28699.1 hypothetical protein TRIADDRAFT_51876 [Trichoplax adhaerens]RDD44994.1 Exosome complex component RRP41 [Trichoplax sp. H2]|eukprot:XP_002107901.1 hypothetical protein TRIADDRAFT_51876 [Trichoplax adhaerens]